MSASDACRTGVVHYRLLKELGVADLTITIYEDNQGCVKLVENPIDRKRTRHIKIRYHYIRQQFEEGVIKLIWIPTGDQLADMLTKAVPRAIFEKLTPHLVA